MSFNAVLDFSRLRPIHIFKATRFLHTERERESTERVQEIEDSAKECRETNSVIILWWFDVDIAAEYQRGKNQVID